MNFGNDIFFPLRENLCTFESQGNKLTLLSDLGTDKFINVN